MNANARLRLELRPSGVVSVACQSCFLLEPCGGLNNGNLFLNCFNQFCCGGNNDCDHVCPYKPDDYRRRMFEVGGMRFDDLPALRQSPLDLPRYVPMVHHAYRRSDPLKAGVVALDPYMIFCLRDGKYAAVADDPITLRRHFKVADDARIVLRGTAEDRFLERYWEHRKAEGVAAQIARLNVSLFIGPNYSHFLNVPRSDLLYNRKRQLVCLAELSEAGVSVAPMGSARVSAGRLGEAQRVVGITTVFSGDGNYCVSTLSRAVPFEDYAAELLASLQNTIGRLSKSMGWQPKEHVRLVFHAFKPLKEAEEEAVKALIASLGDYDVEYAFLHVVENHPILLFDEAQKGEPAYDGRNGMKGVYAPERGRYLRLSGHEVLITLTGPRDVKQASDGMPRPVLLRLGRGSTFNDMTYLTRQVNTFACHSWRSYFYSPLPVTILYSELIARLLGNLSTLPQWNPIQLVGRIGEGRWFL